jgi:hypothetical protein
MHADEDMGYDTLCQFSLRLRCRNKGYVLTGGTYKGFSDDVLVESKLMVDLPVGIELDTLDRLSFIPRNFWLVQGVSRYVTGW